MSNPFYQADSSYFNSPEVNELPSLPKNLSDPWECKKCSTINPSHQSRCQNPSCDYLNLALVIQPEIRAAPLPKQEEFPPVVNDTVWTCPNQGCKYGYNMKDQATCFKCNTPKPQTQASAPSMPAQGLGQAYPSQPPNQSYHQMAGNQANPGQYQGSGGQLQVGASAGYSQVFPAQPPYSNPGGIPGNPANSGQYQELYAQQGTGPSEDQKANPAFSSFSPNPSAGGMVGSQASPGQFQGLYAQPGISAPTGHSSSQTYPSHPPNSSAGEIGSQYQVSYTTDAYAGQSSDQTYPPQPPKSSPGGMPGNPPNHEYQSSYPQQGAGPSSPAYPSLSPSVNAGEVGGNQVSASAPYQAPSAQPEGQNVEVRASIRLSKDGWICEHCRTVNQVYLNYCSACNQFNSIYLALMQQYQGCFGASQ